MSSTADLVEESAEKKTFKSMTLKEKWRYSRDLVTVEPLLAAYFMASVLAIPALTTLELEKACRVNLDYNDTVCDLILEGENDKYIEENNKIQIAIATVHSWQQPLQSVMPLILVLFLGSYSDRHQLRKPFLLFPIFGEFFAVAGCILCVVFMKSWSLEMQGIAQTVVPSLFGGPTMLIMAAFAYVADVSSLEMRTIRVGMVQIVLNVCHPIVQSFSGILFTKIGYNGILGIAAGLFLFAILYGYFCIKEPKVAQVTEGKSFLTDAFNPKHALDTFNLLLKETPGNNRLFIVLVLLLLFIYNVVVVGEGSLIFLYLQKSFQLTALGFSYLGTLGTVIHMIGNVLGIWLFTKVLQMHDLTILFLSMCDKILINAILGMASTISVIYIGICCSVITGMSSIAIRSMATKIVSENDLGKAQSLFGICEALAQAAAVPFYNQVVYVNTLESFTAMFFFVGIVLYIVSMGITIWMYFKEKKKHIEVHENGTGDKPVQMEDMVAHI